ncbi:MAG: molybdopterin-dependent oxidoreductase [Acidobacteriota bacterium]|nr:molybdopterin-dependent oxidoreductase [Acidobacteriota bacterium]
MHPSEMQPRPRVGLSRRDFLMTTSGALFVGFTMEGGATAQGPFGTRASHIDPSRLDSWLAIAADGSVTAHTGKCELGQGIQTAQVQLVAEELGVPLDRVRLVMCDTEVCPDQGTTSGSQSTPTNFNHENLALAAATAREALLRLAAGRLGVPVGELVTDGGDVRVAADGSRRVGYGELVAGRRFDVPLDRAARRKPRASWRVLGTPAPRIDMAALVTARAEFVHTVRVPGMLHGAVVRPPAVGATLASVDERSVAGLPGVVEVVTRRNFVGIVAEKPWQAVQAARALTVAWRGASAPLPAQKDFHQHLRAQPSRDALIVDSGDVAARLSAASVVLEATYLHPYQMHGSVGSSCAVADVRQDGVTVWSATQSAYPTRSGVAMLLGIAPDLVRVIFTRGSGCYGLNGADTVSYDAALLSDAVKRPVRVQLSRQDEMAWENYGYAYAIDQRAGLAADGSIAAWDAEGWFAARGGRPGYQTPGNVVTGMLVGFEPAPFSPRAATAPSSFNNGSNAAPSYVAGRVGGRASGTGVVASERVRTHTIPSPFFTGPLRSPSRLQNTFAHECFLDEIAAHVRADPVEYRLRHLRDPRLKGVVSAAAGRAGWQARPSPRSDRPRRGVASGRGIACVLYEGDNGYVALVADVDVDQESGTVRATRLVVAQDCGPVSNPDGMRNQLEGGALQGLSRALGEEVTWDDRKVTSIDWRTYRSLALGSPVPAIESVLIDPPDGEAMGAGETAITIVAAAVGNAIFDATGARIREVPFTPERVKTALIARDGGR